MKIACYNVPVSRNGAEPALRWLSHYIITICVAYFVAYTLDWPQLHASGTSTASLWRLKLPVLSYILLKRKFMRQASRQCQRAFDPHTEWRTGCHSLCVTWLHLKCCCDSDSTKVATSHVVCQNAAPHCTIPRKSSDFFPFESATASCVGSGDLNLVTYIQQSLLEQASQRWNPELRSRSHNRNTGAVLVLRAVRLPHAEREVQRRKHKLGTEALRIFLGSSVLNRHEFFFSSVLTRREKEREKEREKNRSKYSSSHSRIYPKTERVTHTAGRVPNDPTTLSCSCDNRSGGGGGGTDCAEDDTHLCMMLSTL